MSGEGLRPSHSHRHGNLAVLRFCQRRRSQAGGVGRSEPSSTPITPTKKDDPMSLNTDITPKMPTSEEMLHYTMMADLPPETLEGLAEALLAARCHATLSIWQNARARLGLSRYIANTALRLAAIKANDGEAFILKLNAFRGIQFNDGGHTGGTIKCLLRAEARRLGVHVPEPEDNPQAPSTEA